MAHPDPGAPSHGNPNAGGGPVADGDVRRGGPAPGGEVRHAERLTVPWWWWLTTVAVAAALAAEVWLGAAGARSWAPFAVVMPPVVVALWWLGRIRVAVVDDELRVDDARLPVRFVADAIAVDAEGRRELLGAAADPLAFVVQRPWIPTAVQVVLDDPADPTPYWLVSSRRPVELAAALTAAAHRGRADR